MPPQGPHPTRLSSPLVAACALVALAAAGCATAPVRAEVVWPPPPETARVRFVSAFQRSSDLDTSASAALLRALFGGDRQAILGRPMGLALSADGQRLYVADTGRMALFCADFAQKAMVELAGPDEVGAVFGVALDADENVYVSDQAGRRVVVLDRSGKQLRTIGKQGELVRPSGLAVDTQRRLLYVADPATLRSEDHRVLVYSLEGELVRTLGRGKGNAPGQFYFPVYLALDAQGRLHVGDTMNFRVQVLEPDGTFVRAYGEHGNGPGTFARLKGLAFDGFGNLYTVEGEYAVVQLFNTRFEPLMFFGGTAPKLEFLELPSAIAIDHKTNRIYVANELNARINVYELINTKAEDALPPPAAPARAAGD